VLAKLTSVEIGLESLALARPSLSDVYLHHVGRSFQQANETAEKKAAQLPIPKGQQSFINYIAPKSICST